MHSTEEQAIKNTMRGIKKMRAFRSLVAATAATLVLAAGLARAGEVTLPAIQFPDNKTIAVPMIPTDKAPTGAKAEAKVEFGKGQGKVDFKFSKMEPAILFGGDIAAYVLWAVQRDGLYENLGEVIVPESDASGSIEASSTLKIFGLFNRKSWLLNYHFRRSIQRQLL